MTQRQPAQREAKASPTDGDLCRTRKQTHYLVRSLRRIALPGGKWILARIDVRIRCPHDAVLETHLERLDAQISWDKPQAGEFNHYPQRGRSRNISPEENLP